MHIYNALLRYAKMRYNGKTSLIMKTLETLKKTGHLTAYIDLFSVASVHDFANLYAKNILSDMNISLEKITGFVRDAIPTLKPEISIDEEGKPTFSFDMRSKEKNLHSVLEMPETIAKKKGKTNGGCT